MNVMLPAPITNCLQCLDRSVRPHRFSTLALMWEICNTLEIHCYPGFRPHLTYWQWFNNNLRSPGSYRSRLHLPTWKWVLLATALVRTITSAPDKEIARPERSHPVHFCYRSYCLACVSAWRSWSMKLLCSVRPWRATSTDAGSSASFRSSFRTGTIALL